MNNEVNEIISINQSKMNELLNLLEELVINKMRVEKINRELKNNEYRKVLEQEIQLVAKVQDVVKSIQTAEIDVIFKKITDSLILDCQKIIFDGKDAEFDINLEMPIFNLIKEVIELLDSNEGIRIGASNNSSGLNISINRNNQQTISDKILSNNSGLSLSYAEETDVITWLEGVYFTGELSALQSIKNLSNTINAVIELQKGAGVLIGADITVPYSSSITMAQFIRLSDKTFAIPVDYIDKIVNNNKAEIRTANSIEFINYMGKLVPIIQIDKILEISKETAYASFVILESNNKIIAIPAQEILEQSDIVVRPKPHGLSEIKEYKGMAILDDGNITIVLDVPSIIQSYT